jgi:hypothetical protein
MPKKTITKKKGVAGKLGKLKTLRGHIKTKGALKRGKK